MPEYMANPENEIDAFIRRFLKDDLIAVACKWFSTKTNYKHIQLNRIKETNIIELSEVEYKYAANITTAGDCLSFDASMLCGLKLRKNTHGRETRSAVRQWLTLRCKVIIDGQYITMAIDPGTPGSPKRSKQLEYAADSSFVPFISKVGLDAEAERFLEEYCPEALTIPMPVPIFDIICNKMGLGVRLGGVLADSDGIIGQICFSDMVVRQVCFQTGHEFENDAPRGTVVVDIRTLRRNEGCVNNTLAHEAFHWYRHRIYGTVRDILHGEQYITCRRTKKKVLNRTLPTCRHRLGAGPARIASNGRQTALRPESLCRRNLLK